MQKPGKFLENPIIKRGSIDDSNLTYLGEGQQIQFLENRSSVNFENNDIYALMNQVVLNLLD